MSKKELTTNHKNLNDHSALDRFNLSFEYNKTLTEVKRDVRTRTI